MLTSKRKEVANSRQRLLAAVMKLVYVLIDARRLLSSGLITVVYDCLRERVCESRRRRCNNKNDKTGRQAELMVAAEVELAANRVCL